MEPLAFSLIEKVKSGAPIAHSFIENVKSATPVEEVKSETPLRLLLH